MSENKAQKVDETSRTKKDANNEYTTQWSRSDKIGLASLLVAVAAIMIGMMTPEFRKLIGLEPGDSPYRTLPSKYGVDYSKLHSLLVSKQFREADIETTHLLLWMASREKQGVLNTKSIKHISCIDFQTIDNLWKLYSNGSFGFSVQLSMWKKMKQHDPEELASQIGWMNNEDRVKYNDLTFDLRAPYGHLPTGGAFAPSGNLQGSWFPILSNQCF